MKRSRKIAALTASVLALTAIAGTFAYYSSTHEVANTMETAEYGDTLTEVFTPDSNWEPGETADKIVGVTNTGDYDIVVRISMSETWTNDSGEIITIDSDESDFLIATASEGDQLSATDGLVDDSEDASLGTVDDVLDTDGSVVYKALASSGWTYNATDGYWYYNSILEPDQVTSSLLTSITLAEDTDMGVYEETVSYVVTSSETLGGEETWIVLGEGVDTTAQGTEVVYITDLADVVVGDNEYLHVKSVSTLSSASGYAGATYVLTIKSETVQATSDAVWSDTPTTLTDVWFPTVTN